MLIYKVAFFILTMFPSPQVSAQESRKKKKVYVDGLEKRLERTDNPPFKYAMGYIFCMCRVEHCTKMNRSLQKKVQLLENHNKSLLQQLKQVQALVGAVRFPSSVQTGTCVMVCITRIFVDSCLTVLVVLVL